QVFRPRLDHKLPFVSAAFVNLGDTRHGPQQRLDGVVMKFAQLEQLLPEQFRSFCVRLVGNVVVENFTQSGADRCELRRDVVWQTLHRGLQALGHELARAITSGLSENWRGTCDKPKFVSERISSMPGNPAISISMGPVTNF